MPNNVLDEPLASAPEQDETTSIFPGGPSFALPGAVIGNYRLMEQIGEGGFGLVFVAEQQRPVRRKVALKVVKPGMDTREVIARFEAERQALALMDHPNIARVLDAGTTDAGRPYFVMELVRGVPITEFCERRQLGLRERLELFITVCNAVQHAHQKGVIHRDLKPSNVLVTLHDEIAVPKVIDFGVAKALGQSLTDKTVYTRFTAMIGTPLYMSPEQAEMSGLNVDTRSDIYSLGVLLYELLTGSTPFSRERFDSLGIDELRRVIREEDPPKPSTMLTTADPAFTTALDGSATAHSSQTRRRGQHRSAIRLSSLVRGDLDWIVMKTLEKDRQRRYESASELADDVRRYLTEQPVSARPPSQWYQLQKFARRNKVALFTVSLIGLTMIVATSVSVWMATVAIAERNKKDAALKEAVSLKREADAARTEIAEFATRMKEANVLVTSGRAHADAQRWAAAYADFTAAIERQPNYYNAWTERASLEVKLGLWKRAAEDYSKAISLGVPADNPANWGIPQLFLFNGDMESHQEYCLSMLDQAEQREEPPSIALIRSCVMASKPVGDVPILAAQALEMVDSTARPERPEPGSPMKGGRPGPPPRRGDRPQRPFGSQPPPRPGEFGGPPGGPRRMWHPRGVTHYTAGLALFRASRYDESIEQFEKALEDDRWHAKAIVHPALAMAHHRAGHAEQARAAFEVSEREIDGWTTSIQQGPVGSMPIPWFDWVECLLLHREASILLTGFAPADDPRLREVQENAVKTLGL